MLARIRNAIFLFGYVHEVWHYLAARAFGLEATLRPTSVDHEEPREAWKKAAITLAPFFVFLAALMLVLVAWLRVERAPLEHRRWALWAAICLGWIGTCWTDLRDVVHLYRAGRWPED